ncbi:hypothetical protein [Actinosynnema sp. NPDC020468]|uniref:hypothetical protein n=1 Tax=Actinosynnema sp. NPDC020468 TaxID=3154488 RepID=UPI0033F5E03C
MITRSGGVPGSSATVYGSGPRTTATSPGPIPTTSRPVTTQARPRSTLTRVTLTEDGHAGETYELSGPHPLTFADAATALSAATGRTITCTSVPEADLVAELVDQGWPHQDAEASAAALTAVRRGLDSHVSDGVQRALGRPPRDFTAFTTSAAAAGHWST